MPRSGPIPKRSDQRRRTNATPGLQQAPAARTVRVPAADKSWHPLAYDWYRSLKASGQSAFYEPSDWQTARLLAEQMSRLLLSDELHASMFNTVLQGMKDLLTTEGQRRRLRLELLRESGVTESDPGVARVDNIIAGAFPSA